MYSKISMFLVVVLFAGTVYGEGLTLKSSELGGQFTTKQVFNGFGCSGNNISPQLNWDNAPKGTKSFAVTIHDADVPSGSGWWHWVIFDIPAATNELKADAGNPDKNLAPTGSVQSGTDFGKPGYGGPCPPEGHGFHRYLITVYALKTEKLGLDKNAVPALVGYYLHSATIQKASIVAYYKR